MALWGSESGSATIIKWLLTGLAFVLVAIAAGVVFAFFWFEPPPGKTVVAEWNDTISRLGIEPVFPPEEDIYVGDIFAVITKDHRPGESAAVRPQLNRAIKLSHIDMTLELTETYSKLPLFPDTPSRPTSADQPLPANLKPEGIFAKPERMRGMLAIAAFPGFSIRQERSAAGGFGGWIQGVFGVFRNESDLVSMSIPLAETYGVPSLVATGRLARFCADPFTRDACSEATLRRHLSYVTPEVLETFTDPATGLDRYYMDVEIVLVNRVYLTRSILQTRTQGRDSRALLRLLKSRSDKQDKPEAAGGGAAPMAPAPAQAGDAPAAPLPGGAGPAPAEAAEPPATTQVESRIADLLDGLSDDDPELSASLISEAHNRIELKRNFLRPVVFGYRAVRNNVSTSINVPTSKEKTGGTP